MFHRNYKLRKNFLPIILSFFVIATVAVPVGAATQTDWKSLYKSKVQQIENEYRQEKRTKDDVYDTLFFSLQDFNFDGIPELYHTLVKTDKEGYKLQEGSEEIYYIKNNRVVLGKIESHSTLGLLPDIIDNGSLDNNRWQLAVYNTEKEKAEFITKDNLNFGKGITLSALSFDIDKGVLKISEINSLPKCEIIGAGSYYSVSPKKNRDIWDWEAPYIEKTEKETNNNTVKQSEKVATDWNGAYKQFIADKKYVNTRQKFYTENSDKILFGLYDLDGNGTPELIIKNGADEENDMVNYAYTYKNKSVTYLDKIGDRDSSFKYVSGFPGLYWESGSNGTYIGYYFTLKNSTLNKEKILEETLEYKNSKMNYNEKQITKDNALYNACKKAESMLPMYNANEINSMGWDTFVSEAVNEYSYLYDDVNSKSWCFDAVKYARDNSLMSGTSPNLFEPDGEITRAMVVTILYRMEKEPNTKKVSYKDVESGSWYENAVSWASIKGIVNGVEKNLFAPDENITREQLAAILYRYAKYKGLNVKVDSEIVKEYIDNQLLSDYASDSVGWAIGNGLISGTDKIHITPQGNATRAQAAVVLYRFCTNLKR